MMTIFLPSFSGRWPTSIAAFSAAPEENADRHALKPGPLRGGERKGIVVFHLHDLVVNRGIEHAPHEARADALDFVRGGANRRTAPARRRVSTAITFTPGFFPASTPDRRQ